MLRTAAKLKACGPAKAYRSGAEPRCTFGPQMPLFSPLTQASAANHSCSVRQIGQNERAKNTGVRRKRSGSELYPVRMLRPVSGQRITTAPMLTSVRQAPEHISSHYNRVAELKIRVLGNTYHTNGVSWFDAGSRDRNASLYPSGGTWEFVRRCPRPWHVPNDGDEACCFHRATLRRQAFAPNDPSAQVDGSGKALSRGRRADNRPHGASGDRGRRRSGRGAGNAAANCVRIVWSTRNRSATA